MCGLCPDIDIVASDTKHDVFGGLPSLTLVSKLSHSLYTLYMMNRFTKRAHIPRWLSSLNQWCDGIGAYELRVARPGPEQV